MSAGAKQVPGSLDFLECDADVAPVGVSRMRRKGGLLEVSTDGAAYEEIGSGSGGGGAFAAQLGRAQERLGPTIVKAFGSDCDTLSWFGTATVANNGTATLSTTERGGRMNCASSATANGIASIRPSGLAGLVINPSTELFYVEYYGRVATVPDALAYVAFALTSVNSTCAMFFGALGAESEAEFAYDFYDDSGVQTEHGELGVDVDTDDHRWAFWGDGVNWYIDIDDVNVLEVEIPAASVGPCNIRLTSANGGTAANQLLVTDEVVVCTAA